MIPQRNGRNYRFFAALVLAVVMAFCSTKSEAVNVAVTAAHTTARVATNNSARSPDPERRPSTGVCLWRIPTIHYYINLYTLQRIYVKSEIDDRWKTSIFYGDRDVYELITVKGQPQSYHVDMIFKRLQECSEGKVNP